MGKLRTFHGCIYGAEVADDGSLQSNWEELGEAYPLSIKLTDEIVKVMGRTCVTFGKVIGTKVKPGDAGGSLTLWDYTAKNISKALKGMVSTRNVSSTTLTAEPVTLGKFGGYVDIGTEDLSDVVVKDATDTTTYTLGSDYSLNSVLGLISPMAGGTIAEDAVVHISAAGGANTGQRVTIGAGSSKKLAIKGSLVDEFEQNSGKFYLRKVLLVSSNEIIILSDDGTEREQIDFELVPEIPTGQTDYGTFDGLPL